jgi:hypothetical protein
VVVFVERSWLHSNRPEDREDEMRNLGISPSTLSIRNG